MRAKVLSVWDRVMIDRARFRMTNVEESLHASLRPHSTTSRDAALLAELRRSLRVADLHAQQ